MGSLRRLKTKTRWRLTTRNRLEVANALKLAVSLYFSKKMFGVYHEVGVIRRGRRRADVLAVNMKGHIVICEVKSCRADFVSDKKLTEYLDYCHKMYLVVLEEDYDKWLKPIAPDLDKRVGILVLQSNGYCKVVRPCKFREQEFPDLYYKLAWRGSTYNKSNTRMRRVYV